MVGRLRRASLVTRAEMLAAIHQAGFDLTFAQVAIFRGPGPDGRRPSEVAASAGMSKQSVNDSLRYCEEHGDPRLRPDPTDGRGRIVRLTAKGRRLDAAIWQAGRRVEQAWAEQIGEPAWTNFREVLDTIAPVTSET